MRTFAVAIKRSSLSALLQRTTLLPSNNTFRNSERVAVRRILRGPLLQAKLTIGAPNDIYEQEADRVADEVMRMPEPRLQAAPT